MRGSLKVRWALLGALLAVGLFGLLTARQVPGALLVTVISWLAAAVAGLTMPRS